MRAEPQISSTRDGIKGSAQRNCAIAENLPSLKPQAALERVARDLSLGNKLQQRLKAAGYRATRSSALSITGDGSNPAQRVERAGYRYRATGENIAGGGQMKAEDAVAGWIKSPGHCANLMIPAFIEMGAAFAVNARSDMGVYWTQAFGAPR